MAWIIPNEIQQGRNYSTLSDKDLIYNHGQLHIFWKKLEDGYPLAWTFEEIYEEHNKTVNELSKRKISHLASINELDDVKRIETKSEKLSQKFAYSVEKKLRGLQVNVHKKDNEVKIFSEENELTEIFPKIVENVKKISMSNFAIDGEIILYDNEKILSRNELNKRIESNQILEDVKLFVWDIPYYNEPIDEFLLKE